MNSTKNSKILKFHFISTYNNFDKEESGIKPYTIRRRRIFTSNQIMNLATAILDDTKIEVTIQRAYTKKKFTRKCTDITIFGNNVIFAWGCNHGKK